MLRLDRDKLAVCEYEVQNGVSTRDACKALGIPSFAETPLYRAYRLKVQGQVMREMGLTGDYIYGRLMEVADICRAEGDRGGEIACLKIMKDLVSEVHVIDTQYIEEAKVVKLLPVETLEALLDETE